MDEYISREAAVDAGYLSDWYISSVGDEPPVWTDAHIDELLNDFIVVPKDTKAADVQPIKHGHWIECCNELDKKCSCCDKVHGTIYEREPFCPNCGTRMEGDIE